MKKLCATLSILIIYALSSCQDKTQETAQKAIDRYIIFVDSVNEADAENRQRRWEFIVEEHARKRNDAESALGVMKGKDLEKETKRVAERDSKFEGIRVQVEQ